MLYGYIKNNKYFHFLFSLTYLFLCIKYYILWCLIKLQPFRAQPLVVIRGTATFALPVCLPANGKWSLRMTEQDKLNYSVWLVIKSTNNAVQ